jgi:methylthioribulose-1-phosphate dehydratase
MPARGISRVSSGSSDPRHRRARLKISGKDLPILAPGDPRRQLAARARDLYRRGWMSGTAGNLSRRQADGSYWITASGKSKGDLTHLDFLRLLPGGEVAERGRAGDRPSAESSLHDAVYRLFPQAGACFHVHSVAANLVSRLGAPGATDQLLPPIEMLKGLGVPDESPRVAIAVFGNHAHVPAIAAEVEARFRAAPPRLPGFLIRDHGLTVWGDDPRAALNHLELFDFIFQCMLAARAAGLDG